MGFGVWREVSEREGPWLGPPFDGVVDQKYILAHRRIRCRLLERLGELGFGGGADLVDRSSGFFLLRPVASLTTKVIGTAIPAAQ